MMKAMSLSHYSMLLLLILIASVMSAEQQPRSAEQQTRSTEQQPRSAEQQTRSTEQQPRLEQQQPRLRWSLTANENQIGLNDGLAAHIQSFLRAGESAVLSTVSRQVYDRVSLEANKMANEYVRLIQGLLGDHIQVEQKDNESVVERLQRTRFIYSSVKQNYSTITGMDTVQNKPPAYGAGRGDGLSIYFCQWDSLPLAMVINMDNTMSDNVKETFEGDFTIEDARFSPPRVLSRVEYAILPSSNSRIDIPWGVQHFLEISKAQKYSAALRTDGRVFLTFEGLREILLPTSLFGNEPVVHLASGYAHTAMLTKSGQVYILGKFSYNGQLRNDNASYNKPTPIKDLYDVSQIVAGPYYTVALKQDRHRVYVFGKSFRNARNYGGNDHVFPVILESEKEILQIAVVSWGVLALTVDGELLFWKDELPMVDNEDDNDDENGSAKFSRYQVYKGHDVMPQEVFGEKILKISASNNVLVMLTVSGQVFGLNVATDFGADRLSAVPIRLKVLEGKNIFEIQVTTYDCFHGRNNHQTSRASVFARSTSGEIFHIPTSFAVYADVNL